MAASLFGRTAIVTGAYGGLGYAIANRFAREGASLVLVGRNQARLNTATERLEKEYSSPPEKRAVSIRNFVCDVSRNEDWENLVSTSVSSDVVHLGLSRGIRITRLTALFRDSADTHETG